jgi:Short C-terminal domain/Phospholipase_D-nuclease N-terminal
MDSFGEVLWWTFMVFLFFAYLMVLWTIFSDLFADGDTSGVVKAIWVVLLIFFPLITALVYLIARGKGMQDRKLKQLAHMQAAQEAYIKQVAGGSGGGGGKSASEQIAHAKELLDGGAISQAEYDQLKAKALA